jgi:hypothetical protein
MMNVVNFWLSRHEHTGSRFRETLIYPRRFYKFNQGDGCKTKWGEKAQHTQVCEHFEPYFDAAKATSGDL